MEQSDGMANHLVSFMPIQDPCSWAGMEGEAKNGFGSLVQLTCAWGGREGARRRLGVPLGNPFARRVLLVTIRRVS